MADDDPLFVRREPSEATFEPTVYTRGPWDPTLLHGGPVGALFAELLQDELLDEFQPARLTVDLMRPVPLAPLRAETRIVRAGRRLQLVEAVIEAVDSSTAVARATLLALRRAAIAEAEYNPPIDRPPDAPDDAVQRLSFGRNESFVGGATDFLLTPTSLGQGVAWLRLRRDVLPGRAPSPLARAAAAADVGNAVSSRRDPNLPRLSYVNADFSLSLSRLPSGEWIRLASRSRWEATGIGWVTSTMGDVGGEFASVSNALVLA